jgi:low temperature requirement protein LtrA
MAATSQTEHMAELSPQPTAESPMDISSIPRGPFNEPSLIEEKKVTSLELFFDLVFVFAITQVSRFVSTDPTWTRFIEGLAVLAVLWFAWSGYAWLGNTADAEQGDVRVMLLAAMAAMLIVSLAVPHAFGSDGLIFGVGFLTVRLLHIGTYTMVARKQQDQTLTFVVGRIASTMLPAAALLVAAGALSGTPRAVCWIAAICVDYGGILARGVEGWRITAGHFAERHGLIIIIALGESIVSLGVGAGTIHLGAGIILGSLLGITVAAALWWAYFDVVALVGERRLRAASASQQATLARDSYTYLHLPMVAGIVFFAIGVNRTLADFRGHLTAVSATALCGGVALYLLALSSFKRRNVGSFNNPRLVVAAVLAAFSVLAPELPALLSLGLVAISVCGLITFEVVHYTDARQRIRHADST